MKENTDEIKDLEEVIEIYKQLPKEERMLLANSAHTLMLSMQIRMERQQEPDKIA